MTRNLPPKLHQKGSLQEGPVQRVEVYCDESRPEYLRTPPPIGAGYVLIGGLWLRTEDRAEMKERLKQVRSKHNLKGEFKWNRVSPSRLAFYEDLVRLFFDSPMAFRCIALPAGSLDAKSFHHDDNELMFYKFYYQLLVHWLENGGEYHIIVDLRTNRLPNRLRVLERVLRAARPGCRNITVQALPSRQVDFLQLTDVLLGATGSRLHERTTSQARWHLVQCIERYLGRPIGPTSRTETKFNIFMFRPRTASSA